MCPVCGQADVAKAAMAPNVAAKGNRAAAAGTRAPDHSLPALAEPAARPAFAAGGAARAIPPELVPALAALARAQAEALPRSTWVGRNFAEQARERHAMSIEDGVTPAAIHGEATIEEAEALVEDGIAVMPLLVPFVAPDFQN